MTDLTGKVIYSNVIGVRSNNTTNNEAVSIYPNIISGNTMYMEVSQALTNAKLIVSDAGGRTISQKNIGRVNKGQISSFETSSAKLPAGVYFLQVADGNESISVKRFIVK